MLTHKFCCRYRRNCPSRCSCINKRTFPTFLEIKCVLYYTSVLTYKEQDVFQCKSHITETLLYLRVLSAITIMTRGIIWHFITSNTVALYRHWSYTCSLGH